MACRHRIKFGGCSIVHFILLCTPQYEHTDSPSMYALRMEYEPTISVTLWVQKKHERNKKTTCYWYYHYFSSFAPQISYVQWVFVFYMLLKMCICDQMLISPIREVRLIVFVHLMQNTEVSATIHFLTRFAFFYRTLTRIRTTQGRCSPIRHTNYEPSPNIVSVACQ